MDFKEYNAFSHHLMSLGFPYRNGMAYRRMSTYSDGMEFEHSAHHYRGPLKDASDLPDLKDHATAGILLEILAEEGSIAVWTDADSTQWNVADDPLHCVAVNAKVHRSIWLGIALAQMWLERHGKPASNT